MKNGIYLVTGHDFEGDTREWWTMTLAAALKGAQDMTRPCADGPAWNDWEIWGNDAVTEDWKPLFTSENFKL